MRTTPLASGFVIAAPRSGSGKTLVALGIIAALRARGLTVAPAKTGPDYIDTAILARVAGRSAINLDPWAMPPQRLHQLARSQADGADALVVEGVMGLFDGAADGTGSTADLANLLGLPVVFVVDAERQSQSIAPLVSGFAQWRPDLNFAGVILNRVATQRHEDMLRRALQPLGLRWLGALPRRDAFKLPERHLGLVLPGEAEGFDAVVTAAAAAVADYIDLEALQDLNWLAPPLASPPPPALPPLGQRVAVARDDAFAFVYPHWLSQWRDMGAEISFFSPLADEAPDPSADAVFLPGGYPELHGARLATTGKFRQGLLRARDRGALIYGECGGFMVLGRSLTDKQGVTYPMTGLLAHDTTMETRPVLGYRRLTHSGLLPWPHELTGHEFHYSAVRQPDQQSLFVATDALGTALPPMGVVSGRVMGSYAHVIDVAG